MAWKSLSDDRLLWQGFIAGHCNASSLTILSRRVIGAWESTEMDWNESSVSEYLRVKREYAKALLTALNRSVHPVIVKAIEFGLPVEAAVYVNPEWGLKCKYCRATLSSVPCNACLIRANRHDDSGISWKERFPLHLREPAPTLHQPGSEGKFKVICQRAARGEKVFSNMDAKADLR